MTDTYSKGLLTIIAACMLAIVARVYDNPAPAFAQNNPKSSSLQPVGPQHVIIDGVGPMVFRGIPVTIEGLAPSLQPLAVELKANPLHLGQENLHVIIDDLDPGLALRGGLLVKPQDANLGRRNPAVQWQYDIGPCPNLSELENRAAAGWEFIEAMVAPDAQEKLKDQEFTHTCAVYWRRPVSR